MNDLITVDTYRNVFHSLYDKCNWSLKVHIQSGDVALSEFLISNGK
jgi:hypothetical protein